MICKQLYCGDIMEKEKLWLKFILTGKAEDYLSYTDAKESTDRAVNGNSHFNRGSGYRSEQYR